MPQPPEPAALRCLITTFAKEEEAAEVTRTLVRERLAACGTLIRNARSIYTWQGNLEDTEEIVVILKTTRADDAGSRLKELHPYDVPEILVLTPESANAAYSKWVADACSSQ